MRVIRGEWSGDDKRMRGEDRVTERVIQCDRIYYTGFVGIEDKMKVYYIGSSSVIRQWHFDLLQLLWAKSLRSVQVLHRRVYHKD